MELFGKNLEGDEGFEFDKYSDNFGLLSVSSVLVFHKHNSLSLGPLRAFITFH